MTRIWVFLTCVATAWLPAACRLQPAPELFSRGFGRGHTVYIGQDRQVQVYDVSRPDELRLITTWETPGRVRRIVTDGHRVYVVHWPSEESWDSNTGPPDGGVQLVNVSRPNEPRIEGYFTTHNLAEDVAVHGDVIFTSDWEHLYTVQWDTPQRPQEMSRLPQGSAALEVDENLLFGVWGGCSFRSGACQGGLWLADVSGEQQTPVSLSSFISELRPGYDVALLKTAGRQYALVAGRGLWVVDITDLTIPQEVAYVATTDGYYHARIVVKENIAVLASDAHIRVYDVSQPERPLEVGQMAWGSPPVDMMWANDGERVYLATWDGLSLVDVSDPQRPFLIASTPDVPIPPPQPTVTP